MKTIQKNTHSQRGFTIVELLVVIVVISILAAITIVAYNGVQSRARAAAAQAAANGLVKLLAISYGTSSTYPADLSAINNGGPMPTSDGSSYIYHPGAGYTSYCVTVTNSTSSYKITDTSTSPVAGGCPGDGVGGVPAITNLAANPSAETNLSGWQTYGGTGGAVTAGQIATSPQTGTYAYRATWTTATASAAGIYYGTTTDAVQPSTTYNFSGYVRPSKAQSVQANIEWYNSANSLISRAGAVTTGLTANTWTRLSVSGPSPAGTTWARITFYAPSGWNVGDTFDADGMMLTQGSTLYNYADGNSPNWIWSNATNNSTSTGPPQ